MRKINNLIIVGLVGFFLFSGVALQAQNRGDKKIITLRSFFEKYVRISTGTDNKVFADFKTPVEKVAQFKVYDLGNDMIALKSSSDKYLTYTDKGLVEASKIMIGVKEKFKVVKISEEWIALQASNGTYMSLDPKKKDQVIVGKTTIAEWESFNITVIYNPEVKIVELALSGNVIDNKSKKPLVAKIEISNMLSGEMIAELTTGVDGAFTSKIPGNSKLSVVAKCAKYLPLSLNFETGDKSSVKRTFELTPIEVGGMVKLNNILFQLGKSTLKAESYSELDRITQVFVDNASMEVEISGHTDSDGSDTYNQKLSQDRANAVKDYFISKGIAATRIIAVGYGESKPIAANDTDEGKELNRRVEFKILKN